MKVFDVAVMVQRSEEDSSEGDVEEPLLALRPSPVETSAALDLVANITMFEDADMPTWEFVFF